MVWPDQNAKPIEFLPGNHLGSAVHEVRQAEMRG
jgi:hypothetical protein